MENAINLEKMSDMMKENFDLDVSLAITETKRPAGNSLSILNTMNKTKGFHAMMDSMQLMMTAPLATETVSPAPLRIYANHVEKASKFLQINAHKSVEMESGLGNSAMTTTQLAGTDAHLPAKWNKIGLVREDLLFRRIPATSSPTKRSLTKSATICQLK